MAGRIGQRCDEDSAASWLERFAEMASAQRTPPPTPHVPELEKLTVSAAIRSISFLCDLRFGRWEGRDLYL